MIRSLLYPLHTQNSNLPPALSEKGEILRFAQFMILCLEIFATGTQQNQVSSLNFASRKQDFYLLKVAGIHQQAHRPGRQVPSSRSYSKYPLTQLAFPKAAPEGHQHMQVCVCSYSGHGAVFLTQNELPLPDYKNTLLPSWLQPLLFKMCGVAIRLILCFSAPWL